MNFSQEQTNDTIIKESFVVESLAFGISSDKYYLPINDNNSRFDLVEIKTTHPNVQPTPHCKIHGAMNVVGVFENGKLWRCLQSKALKDCRAGCEERYGS